MVKQLSTTSSDAASANRMSVPWQKKFHDHWHQYMPSLRTCPDLLSILKWLECMKGSVWAGDRIKVVYRTPAQKCFMIVGQLSTTSSDDTAANRMSVPGSTIWIGTCKHMLALYRYIRSHTLVPIEHVPVYEASRGNPCSDRFVTVAVCTHHRVVNAHSAHMGHIRLTCLDRFGDLPLRTKAGDEWRYTCHYTVVHSHSNKHCYMTHDATNTYT